MGASGAIVLLRGRPPQMFPPERRARGVSLVLFGAVSAAIFGPLVFGPMFAGRELTPDELVVPWLSSTVFLAVGLVISFAVRPDPKTIGESYGSTEVARAPAAPLKVILRRPGVGTAVIGAVTSFAVMVAVMNLSGYVAIDRHHHQSDVFTIISAHIVGMYGLILFVGDIVDRLGRRSAIVVGLRVMATSNILLWPLDGLVGMSLSRCSCSASAGALPTSRDRRARRARGAERARPADRLQRPARGHDGRSARARRGARSTLESGATALAVAARPGSWPRYPRSGSPSRGPPSRLPEPA